MKLLFVEWPEQVDYLLEQGEDIAQYNLVAVNVTVGTYLAERHISYTKIDEYLDYKVFLQNTCDGYEDLEKLCNELDHLLHERHPELRQRQLTPFMFNYYYLKIWSDQLSWLHSCINSLLLSLKPTEIRYFVNNHEMLDTKMFWPVVYPLIGKILSSEFEHITKVKIDFDYNWVQACDAVHDEYSPYINNVIRPKLLTRLCNKAVNYPRKLLAKLKGTNYFSISSWIPDDVAFKLNLNKNIILVDKLQYLVTCENSETDEIIYNKLLTHGIIALEVIWPKVKTHILDKLDYFLAVDAKAVSMLEKSKPQFLEMVCGANPEAKIFAKVFRQNNLGVLILQHGALGQHLEKMYKYIDFTVATDYFVYGQAVANYIAKYNHAAKLRAAVVGNNKKVLSVLTKKALCEIIDFDSKLPVFVFQLPGVTGNLYYNSFNCDGDFNEYQRLKQLCEFFESNLNLQLIIKGHPSLGAQESPILRHYHKNLKPNIRVIKDVPLAIISSCADAFITDRPSTGMLEAMLNSKIVIAYNPIMEFWGEDKLLEKAVHFFRDYTDCIDFIKSKCFLEESTSSDDYTKYVHQFCGDTDFKSQLISALSNTLNKQQLNGKIAYDF
jgi:hypothetical protein